MDKIILFDIDRTIFDRDKFLGDFDNLLQNEFKLNDKELGEIVGIYDEIKNDFGYFSYQAYLERIYELVPSLNKKLDYFFQQDNIEKYLFLDSEILFSLNDIRIGVFSKGDISFQKKKIMKFLDILDENLVYIFHDKYKKLSEVINSNSKSEIYLVDDKIDVLIRAKGINSGLVTILVDRKNEEVKANGIDFKLNSLSDIISVLE